MFILHRKVYFDLIKMQNMAWAKHSVKKRVVWEGRRSPMIQKDAAAFKIDKPEVVVEGKRKCRFYPGSKALKEICKFQKSMELLILKVAFYHVVCEVMQKEKLWYKIQANAILASHEATETFLVWLFEDSNLCTMHTKCVTIMPKDV